MKTHDLIKCIIQPIQRRKRMNKGELVETILKNKEAGFCSKASAEKALNAVIDGIETGIKKDGCVQLIGFGTFAVKNRAARNGRNPKTGQTIKIKASKTVGFKCGAALKEMAKKTK
ncbi:MAG: HU family DNA-binding protein [Candidatus Aureabacteria bacterium]|nr:HU family DNA-binding protein [Candidatus Auribacterota bacterium]